MAMPVRARELGSDGGVGRRLLLPPRRAARRRRRAGRRPPRQAGEGVAAGAAIARAGASGGFATGEPIISVAPRCSVRWRPPGRASPRARAPRHLRGAAARRACGPGPPSPRTRASPRSPRPLDLQRQGFAAALAMESVAAAGAFTSGAALASGACGSAALGATGDTMPSSVLCDCWGAFAASARAGASPARRPRGRGSADRGGAGGDGELAAGRRGGRLRGSGRLDGGARGARGPGELGADLRLPDRDRLAGELVDLRGHVLRARRSARRRAPRSRRRAPARTACASRDRDRAPSGAPPRGRAAL